MKCKTRLAKTSGASAVAIGNFDGFHNGHKKIVETLRNVSRQKGLHSIILTFHPHPRVFFHHPIQLISTDEQRREMLRRQPLDYLFFIDFVRVADCPAEDFVRRILLETLQMKVLVVGRDFRCGRDREGDLEFLKKLAAIVPFSIIQVKPVRRDGTPVASSTIRKLLAVGAVAAARRMLGHPYAVDGYVEKGAGRGKELGFPTINLSTANPILPLGVFHTQIQIAGKRYESVTNIGHAPTFEAGAGAGVRVETHIPGFQRMIYGKKATIFFIDKIRAEKKFASSGSLIEQIRLDIASLNI